MRDHLHMRRHPAVSVIVCTHNPRPVLFDWMFASIESQTLPAPQFEVVVVDNNSTVPLDEERLRSRGRVNVKVVREPKLGLSHARCAGILAAQSDLLVFVDDDNHLFPDYLENTIAIAARASEIGHFGGIARPLHEEPIAPWQAKFLPHLGVRDHGAEPISSRKNTWGAWEPIGAGMVCRRAIAQEFVKVVQGSARAQLLGRRGTGLMSGEDTLFARIAVGLGYACSYQPALRLFHFIRAGRLRFTALAWTLLGHGRSYVLLEELSGRPVKRTSNSQMLLHLGNCAVYHWKQDGLRAGFIQWFWDLGMVLQTRANSTTASSSYLTGPDCESRGEPI
jgi:GT2 family glycosyltransferase